MQKYCAAEELLQKVETGSVNTPKCKDWSCNCSSRKSVSCGDKGYPEKHEGALCVLADLPSVEDLRHMMVQSSSLKNKSVSHAAVASQSKKFFRIKTLDHLRLHYGRI